MKRVIRRPVRWGIIPLIACAASAPATANAAIGSAYVSSLGSNNVAQFDLGAGGALSAKTPPTVASGVGPQGEALSPDGRSLYVVNTTDKTVSEYDIGPGGALSPKTTPTVATGAGPIGVAVSPDGHSVYVTNITSNDVSQYDVGAGGALTPKATPTVAAGTNPEFAAVSPDGHSVYVTNYAGNVSQYDVGAGGLLTAKSSPTVAAGAGALGVAVSPDGHSVYVANVAANTVSQYDVGAGGALSAKAMPTVQAGTKPAEVGVTADSRSVYVTNFGSNDVSQYDANLSGALSAKSMPTVPAGSSPFGVAVSPDGSGVYVANNGGNSISEYDIGAGGALTPKATPSVATDTGPEEIRVLAATTPPPPPPSPAPTPGGGGTPGGGAVARTPVASFSVSPNVVEPLRLALLDAGNTTGASTLLWDLNGDGHADVACSAKAPVLGVRILRPQTLNVRLTAVAADGGSSSFSQALSVRGQRLPRNIVANVPDLATCAPSKNFLGAERFANDTFCVVSSTVTFGIVEATGCLDHVTRRDDVPSAEAAVVDEYYANANLPHFARVICNHGPSPRCTELLTKYTALDLFVSRGRVSINGLTFDPRNGASIVVFPALERVVSHDARVSLGNMTVAAGAIDFDLKSRYHSFKDMPAQGRAPLLDFDGRRDLPSIGGFGLDGQIHLDFVRRDEHRYTEATLNLALPPIFEAFGGNPPSGAVVAQADNTTKGLVLEKLHLSVPEANLGGLRFTNVGFDYSASGNADTGCPRKWWKATANVFLGSTGNDAGFILSPPPSQNGIAFCAGGFASAGGKIVFGAQIPPPQLFPGVLLNEINFALQLNPTLVRGGGRISVANLSDVSGTFLAAFPSPEVPYVLSTADAGRELAPLAGRTLTSTSFALGGAMGLQVPVVGRIPFGSAYFLYAYPDYIALGGGVRVVVPGMSLEGGIDGEASLATKLFSLHGNVKACFAGLPFACGGLEGWVTSSGMVACANVAGWHPGAGYHWGDTWPTIFWGWPGDGCKPSRYWVNVRAARAAAAPLTFTVAAGERAKNVRLRGSGGAPSVEIRGPDGELVSTAAGTFAAGRTIQVLRQDGGKTTWIGVGNGKPGNYTVTTLPGSAPIASLAATRKGYGDIKASVTGTGRRRTLRYDVGPADGQRVTFFERGEATFRRLGTATAGRGAIRFAPALGRTGGREIVAEMQVDGVPGADRVVAHYRAPGPVRTPGPRAVVVQRRGTALLISWTRVADATTYGIVVRQRTGDLRMIKVSARSHSVRVAGIAKTQNGTVAVSARGPLGDWGRPRVGRFRATARPFTVLRPFKQLGRGGRGRR